MFLSMILNTSSLIYVLSNMFLLLEKFDSNQEKTTDYGRKF